MRLWTGQELYFLAEISAKGLDGFLFGLDSDKKLKLLKTWTNTSWSALARSFSLARMAKHAIVAADTSYAYTAIVPIRLLRENPKTALFSVELENMISQEVGKVFNQCRIEAGKELGVDDLDVVLANSRVVDFKIDGHRVLEPIGFKANRIEAVMELSLTTRPIFSDLKSFFKNKNFFFVESGRASLSVLQLVEHLPLTLIRLNSPTSSYLQGKDAVVGADLKRGKLEWNEGSILGAIETEWGVSHETAESLYESYLDGNMSPSGTRFFKEILERALQPLQDELRKTKLKGQAYLESSLTFPFTMPYEMDKLELLELPFPLICERSGFEISSADWNMPQNLLWRRLAPFFSYYHDRSETNLNRWLRRHLNWLGAPTGH